MNCEAVDMKKELKGIKRCIDFKGLRCQNTDCKRYLCPLNWNFDEFINSEKSVNG